MIRIYKDAPTKLEIMRSARLIEKNMNETSPAIQNAIKTGIDALKIDKYAKAAKAFNVVAKGGNASKIAKTRVLCKALSKKIVEAAKIASSKPSYILAYTEGKNTEPTVFDEGNWVFENAQKAVKTFTAYAENETWEDVKSIGYKVYEYRKGQTVGEALKEKPVAMGDIQISSAIDGDNKKNATKEEKEKSKQEIEQKAQSEKELVSGDWRVVFKRKFTEIAKDALLKMKASRSLAELNKAKANFMASQKQLISTFDEFSSAKDRNEIKVDVFRTLNFGEISRKLYEKLQEKIVDSFEKRAVVADENALNKIKAEAISELNTGVYKDLNDKFIKRVISFDAKREPKYIKYKKMLEEIISSGIRELKTQKDIKILKKTKDRIYDVITTIEEQMLADGVNNKKTLSVEDVKMAWDQIYDVYHKCGEKLIKKTESSATESIEKTLKLAKKTDDSADACYEIVKQLKQKLITAKHSLKTEITTKDVLALKSKSETLIQNIEEYLSQNADVRKKTEFRALFINDDIHVSNIIDYSKNIGLAIDKLESIYSQINNALYRDIRELEGQKTIYGTNLRAASYYKKEISDALKDLEDSVKKDWTNENNEPLNENITTKDKAVLKQIRAAISYYDASNLLLFEYQNGAYKYGVHSENIGEMKKAMQGILEFLGKINIPDSVSSVENRFFSPNSSTGKIVRQRTSRAKREIQDVISILDTYSQTEKRMNENPIDQTYAASAMKLLGKSIEPFRFFRL